MLISEPPVPGENSFADDARLPGQLAWSMFALANAGTAIAANKRAITANAATMRLISAPFTKGGVIGPAS